MKHVAQFRRAGWLKSSARLALFCRDGGSNLPLFPVSTYVEIEDTREKIDIKVLNEEIEEIVKKQNLLRKEIDKVVAEIKVGDIDG